MATLTALDIAEARELARGFGLELAGIDALTAGSVNSNFRLQTVEGKIYFARIYEEQDLAGARADVKLSAALHRSGVPTAAPVFRTDGEPIREFRGKAFAVTEWVPGETLCQKRVEARHTEAVGAALAEVHAASPKLGTLPDGRFGPEGLVQRLDRIEGEAEPSLKQAARTIRQKLSSTMERRDAALPHGLIHGDLFRDNVLWQDGKIRALIDFESACNGPFAFDIMVCLQAWCYTDRFVPELVTGFLRGYRQHRRLHRREVEALPVEGALVALRFATTRITDFSMRASPGAAPVRDYRRFLQRLEAIEAGALTSIFEDELRLATEKKS